MLEVLERTVSITRCLVDSFDPSSLSGPDAKAAVLAFSVLEKLAASGKLLAAGRLDETGAWVGDGTHRDIEAFLAATSGTSVGAGRAAMETARQVKTQPAVRDALRRGELSPGQANAVSAAVKADPDCAVELVGVAKTAGFKGLKTECDRVTAAARSRENEIENSERIYANRSLRHRKMSDGSGRIDIHGPLDRTAQIMAALEPLERELFEQNRKTSTVVHPDAVAFDAMTTMADLFTNSPAVDDDTKRSANGDGGDSNSGDTVDDTDDGGLGGDGEADTAPTPNGKQAKTRGARPLAVIVVHMSYAAYLRGHTVPGEICEIEGAGPITVATAYRLASDSFMKAIVADGVDVSLISHLGRTIPAHLRTGVEVRDQTCNIEGCEIDRHLEIDHNIPVAAGGLTCLANIGRLCHHHHYLKTLRDLRRIGPHGNQKLVTKQEYERAGPGP